jgi:phage terminase large subunit
MIPDLQVTPVFEKNYQSYKRIVVNRGGTRSSKTWSICQLLVLWLFTGRIGEGQMVMAGVAAVVRRTLPALKASAMRDFEEILFEYDLYKFVDHNKSDHTYKYKGRMVEFFSVDDEQKVRSRKRAILYCVEANEIEFKPTFYQLLLRTTGKIFMDFNPDDENIWINIELEQKRAIEKKDVEVIVSSYEDNTFLDDNSIAEIEYMIATDPEYAGVFGRGEYGKLTGLIFPNVNIVESVPEGARLVGRGLDFGFTNHPSAWEDVYLNNGELWLDEMFYERGLTNPDIAQRFKQNGVLSSDEIIADSAEPKSIAEIYNAGFNIIGADKGDDSIRTGINILKRYKINITYRSVGLLKERKKYKWATDKNGNTLNIPLDKWNHGWDAVRYVALRHLAIEDTNSVTADFIF